MKAMMKNKKIYISLLVLFLSIIGFNNSSFAQTELDTTTIITVKPFNPTLSDAIKIKDNPSIQDTDKIVPTLTYGFLSKQVPVDFEVSPILPAKIKGEPLVKLYHGYSKLGFGTNSTPLAELYFNSTRNKEYSYGFHGKHFSSKGISSNDYSAFSDNHIGLFGKRFLKDFTLKANFDYDRNVIHYYGFPENSNPDINDESALKQRFNKFGGSAGLTRNFTDSSQFDYNFDLSYHHLSAYLDVAENSFNLNGSLSKFHKKELYEINVVTHYNQLNNLIDDNNTMIIGLNPHIKTTSDKWQFNVGLGLYISQMDKSKFHFYPQAEFKYDVVEHIIIPYVGITGGVTPNNLNTFINDNPFINTTTLAIANTNQKYNIYAGIRGSISNHLTFNTSFSKQKLETLPLYVKDFSNVLENQFAIIYDTLALTQISGELAYQKLEKFKIILKGDYYGYTPENEIKAWHKPSMKINLNGIYDLSDKIIVRADLFYIDKQFAKIYTTFTDAANQIITKAEAKELKGVIDANLGIEYRYTKKLSAFIHFNNIASTKYQRWQDYPTQRFMVLGGLTYSF